MSLLFRTKKKLATATMNTKAGRKAVLALLGDEGNKVLDAIKAAIQKHKDEKTGKEKKKDMLKLALKLKILFDNGKLTAENTKHLSTPLMNLCNHVVDYLSPRETDWKDVEKKKATDDLVKEFTAIHKLLEELLKEKMKPKNLEKLTSLVQTVGAADFIIKVREQKEYKEEKDVILANLEGLLLTEDAVGGGGKSLHCLAPGCHAPRVPEMKDSKPPFPGSELCSYHHYMKYDQLLREPDFNAWLNDEELRNIMNPFMVKEGQEKCLAFQVAVENYTVISNPATRKTRAPKIVSKFFESKELQLDGATVKQIKDAIAGTTPLSKTLFQPATEQVRKRMEKVFLDKFIKTKEYKDWAVTVALPDAMAADIKKKLDEQTKKVDDAQRKAEASLQAHTDKKVEVKKS